jgi:RpiR family transcriptional regulator, carbohydrate utilization regulator
MDQSRNMDIPGDTFAHIRSMLPALSPSERKVGEYVLEHSEKVVRLTLAEIAKQAGVSDATAVRFCRSLGYDGWVGFKFALVQTLPHTPQLIHNGLSNNDDPGTLARKVLLGSKQALDDTLAILDINAFQKAVSVIAGAKKIMIAGVGTSGPMAHEMYNRLFRLGLNCQVQTDSYLQIMQVALLTPEDVLIVISQTGDSDDPRRTASEAKRSGVPVICITGNILSQLTEFADVVLLSVSQESMPETISSRIAQYGLIHALYICLAMSTMEKTIENEETIWHALMRKSPYQSGES